jgi:hypothetical protein
MLTGIGGSTIMEIKEEYSLKWRMKMKMKNILDD